MALRNSMRWSSRTPDQCIVVSLKWSNWGKATEYVACEHSMPFNPSSIQPSPFNQAPSGPAQPSPA